MKLPVLAPTVVALLILGACTGSGSDDTTGGEASTTAAEPAAEASGRVSAADELGIAVNDHRLTVAEFDEQLESWAGFAEAAGETVRDGDAYLPDFVATVTEQYIRFESFLDQLAADNIEITADDRAQAESTAAADLTGLSEDSAARAAAVEWLAGLAAVEPSAAELDAYVALHTDELSSGAICSSHILVGSESEADAVAGRLAGGEHFDDLARELSVDTGSGAAGGDLGCVALGTFVTEYEQAALAAEIGSVTEPVESEFGFHLILTREPTTQDLLPVASATIAAENNARIENALDDATVELAPQFGHWDESTHAYTPPA